jgi:hypothetical protein
LWQGCSSNELQQLGAFTSRLETLLATVVVKQQSTPPSTTSATPAKVIAERRRRSKHTHSCRSQTRRSIDWKLVEYIFEPLHARFDFSLEGCAEDEGLNSHDDVPYCLSSDSIMERERL